MMIRVMSKKFWDWLDRLLFGNLEAKSEEEKRILRKMEAFSNWVKREAKEGGLTTELRAQMLKISKDLMLKAIKSKEVHWQLRLRLAWVLGWQRLTKRGDPVTRAKRTDQYLAYRKKMKQGMDQAALNYNTGKITLGESLRLYNWYWWHWILGIARMALGNQCALFFNLAFGYVTCVQACRFCRSWIRWAVRRWSHWLLTGEDMYNRRHRDIEG